MREPRRGKIRYDLAEQLEALTAKFRIHRGQTCDVAGWASQAVD